VFPVPADEQVNVHLSTAGEVEIFIQDISGMVIEKFKSDKDLLINTSAYPAGMYFIRFGEGKQQQYQKLLIVHINCFHRVFLKAFCRFQ
jgi:hypothetical protein